VTVGDLVKVTRASIGVPVGTLGLIVSSHATRGDYDTASGEKIHILQLIGGDFAWGQNRRYLGRDLEVINASR
jgi:hypothetical protein